MMKRLLLIVSLMSLSATAGFAATKATGNAIVEPGEAGIDEAYSLIFDGPEFFRSAVPRLYPDGYFDGDMPATLYIVTESNAGDSGVSYELACAGDADSYDFGIVERKSGSHFLLTGYGAGKEMYVTGIELTWSDYKATRGGLTLVGRVDKDMPYGPEDSVEDILGDNDVELTLMPENGNTVVYELETPVRYIAILHYVDPDSPNSYASFSTAAFSGLKINFTRYLDTEEEEEGEPTGVGSIGTDDTQAEYYDLQGRRVDPSALSHGVYIRRLGTTSTKIIR